MVLYGHLGTPTVEVGDGVIPTTRIGATDAQTSGGPHLHLEIRDYKDHYSHFSANSWFYNPAYYINGSDMHVLTLIAKDQKFRDTVTFVGDDNKYPDPLTQPERIPR